MLQRNQTYEKFMKNVRKSYKKTYDSLLADTRRHRKELRKNYMMVRRFILRSFV